MNIQVEERMQMQGVEGEGGRQIPVVDFRWKWNIESR